jgi:hypothetical protein
MEKSRDQKNEIDCQQQKVRTMIVVHLHYIYEFVPPKQAVNQHSTFKFWNITTNAFFEKIKSLAGKFHHENTPCHIPVSLKICLAKRETYPRWNKKAFA